MITLFLDYNILYEFFLTMWVNTQKKFEEAYNCCLTSVTDDLFVPSALPPETNTHSSYQVKLQKEMKSTQKQKANLPEFLLLKLLPLSYHHGHFWAATLDFTTFHAVFFCMGHTFFYSLAVFV